MNGAVLCKGDLGEPTDGGRKILRSFLDFEVPGICAC